MLVRDSHARASEHDLIPPRILNRAPTIYLLRPRSVRSSYSSAVSLWCENISLPNTSAFNLHSGLIVTNRIQVCFSRSWLNSCLLRVPPRQNLFAWRSFFPRFCVCAQRCYTFPWCGVHSEHPLRREGAVASKHQFSAGVCKTFGSEYFRFRPPSLTSTRKHGLSSHPVCRPHYCLLSFGSLSRFFTTSVFAAV